MGKGLIPADLETWKARGRRAAAGGDLCLSDWAAARALACGTRTDKRTLNTHSPGPIAHTQRRSAAAPSSRPSTSSTMSRWSACLRAARSRRSTSSTRRWRPTAAGARKRVPRCASPRCGARCVAASGSRRRGLLLSAAPLTNASPLPPPAPPRSTWRRSSSTWGWTSLAWG